MTFKEAYEGVGAPWCGVSDAVAWRPWTCPFTGWTALFCRLKEGDALAPDGVVDGARGAGNPPGTVLAPEGHGQAKDDVRSTAPPPSTAADRPSGQDLKSFLKGGKNK
jgi:hypothetical protein